MQAQRNYQNQQGGTSMAGLLGRPRVPPAEAFRAFQESEGLPPVKGATPREEDRTPTPEPPEDEQPETPPQTEELQLVTQQPLLDPESPYLLELKRTELELEVQRRTLREVQAEVKLLREARALEARNEAPTTQAVLQVAARQAEDERTIEGYGHLLKTLNTRLKQLEQRTEGTIEHGAQRLELVEKRLGNVHDVDALLQNQRKTMYDQSNTASIVELQRDEVDKVATELVDVRSEATKAVSRVQLVRELGEERIKNVESRLEFAQDIALRKVHDEALACRAQLNDVEKQALVLAEAVEDRGRTRTERVMGEVVSTKAEVAKEVEDRRQAVQECLNDLEGKWKALGEIRESDLITRADEAEALRTAVALAHRTTVERVNDLSIEVEKATISFEAATTRALARCSRRMASNEKRYGEKFAELEQVLSAEIAARRSGAQKLAGRQMAAEDAQRQDLLEVSSRLGKQLTDMVDDVADATREMREMALRVAQGLSDLRKDMHKLDHRRAQHVRDCMNAQAAVRTAERADDYWRFQLLAKRVSYLEHTALPALDAKHEARSNEVRAEAEAWYHSSISQMKEMGQELQDNLDDAVRNASEALFSSEASSFSALAALDERSRLALSDARATLEATIASEAQYAARMTRNAWDAASSATSALAAGTRALFAEVTASLSLLDVREANDVRDVRDEIGDCYARAVETATTLTTDESSRRQDHVALTKKNLAETQNAIAAAQAAIADARAADLERNLVEAREAYANDAVAEGRAARAAARALVEAEGRERRLADEDYAEQLRSLIAETKGQLQAAAEALVEQARRDANDKVSKEAGNRDALARGLRLEAEERQRALARRTGAASVIDDLVDRVADQMQMARDVKQDDELAACEARSKKRFELSAKALKAEAAYRAVQEDDIRRRFTSSAALDAVVHRIADNEAAARNARMGREVQRVAAESEARDQGLAAALAVERDDRERQFADAERARLVSRSLRRAQNEVHDQEVRQSFEELGERLDTNVTFLGDRLDAAEEAREEGDNELGERLDAEKEEREQAVEDLSDKAQSAMRAGFSDVATDIHRVESSLRASIASTRSESALARGSASSRASHRSAALARYSLDTVSARETADVATKSALDAAKKEASDRADELAEEMTAGLDKVRTEVDDNIKDLMEGQGTLEDALLEKLKAETRANTEADEKRQEELEERIEKAVDGIEEASEKRATELEAANEARANELTERIASEAMARGEALAELSSAVDGVKTSITEVKDELTDKIDDETSNRNQTLDAVRNAAQSSQKAAAEAQSAVDSLRKEVKDVEAKIPKAAPAAPAAPAADAPESSPGD